MFNLRPARSVISFITQAALFALLTWLILRTLGTPFGAAAKGEPIGLRSIAALWWIIGGSLAVALMRRLVIRRSKPHETRLVSDLLAAAIYIAVVFVVVKLDLGLPIGGLLATSGVIAIVLGLALQSTLADVFSGIAVGLERSYKPGDLLWVEGGIEGTVLEVTWRSTQIATGHGNIAIIPNSVIAKARLENRSAPTPMRGETLPISLDPRADPGRCLTVLMAAVRSTHLLLADPAPKAVCTALSGDSARYEIWYSVAATPDLAPARTELITQVHRHLATAAISLAIAGVVDSVPIPRLSIGALLTQSDFFGVLPPDALHLLAAHCIEMNFEPGNVMIREGDVAEASFILATGTVELTKRTAGGHIATFRMGPGDGFGILGLVTGIPHAVTATALTPLSAYRLDKAGISAAIALQPDLIIGLEALAGRVHQVMARELSGHEHAAVKTPEVFLARLRQFLRRLGG